MADALTVRRDRRAGGPAVALGRCGSARRRRYLFFLVAWPVVAGRQEHLRRRLRARCATRSDRPRRRRTPCSSPSYVAVVGGRHQHWCSASACRCCWCATSSRASGCSSALIDLPLSVSPVVVGLALVLVYSGRDGWFGPTLERTGFQVIFATPGMIMATVLRRAAAGDPRGRAGARGDRRRPGAGGPQPRRERRADLPADHAARASSGRVVYGVVLSLARSLGEFGAVKIVVGQHRRPDPDRHRSWSSRSTRTSTRTTAYAIAVPARAASRSPASSSSSRACRPEGARSHA